MTIPAVQLERQANKKVTIHDTAEVAVEATIGKGTRVWHYTHIRPGAKLGENCVIGKDVYIDNNVIIGDNVKIQNRASLYRGIIIENQVSIGSHVCFSNDRRIGRMVIVNPENEPTRAHTVVGYKASIGAGSVILPGVSIGKYALVGPGSVVTSDVPNHAFVQGSPAKIVGYVCVCGRRLIYTAEESCWKCADCEEKYYLEPPKP